MLPGDSTGLGGGLLVFERCNIEPSFLGQSSVWSLLPPLVAIGLAIVTRRVVVSLIAGVFLAALILEAGNPLVAMVTAGRSFFGPSLFDFDHLRVFAFTLMMGAMVGVVGRTGGIRVIVTEFIRRTSSRRSGQLATWGMGLLIFFDDYANTMLLGTTMQPLTDRLKISREKLAYIVDSTAAPVAGLALVSTWVAGEIGYIDDGLKGLRFVGETPGGMQLFLSTIPYRFYVLWSLVMVAFVGLSNRDFGAMLRVERHAWIHGLDLVHKDHKDSTLLANEVLRWESAILPLIVTILTICGVLGVTGWSASVEQGDSLSWMNLIGNSNSYSALVYGALAGLVTASVTAVMLSQIAWNEVIAAAHRGCAMMIPCLAILWTAWSLSMATGKDYLGTGHYLGNLIQNELPIAWLPTIVFLLSSLVSFSTGTSWGTMALLMPQVIPVVHQMLAIKSGGVLATDPILIATTGSVLAGAIFGDHCSPISDTTVLSSQASGCDLMDHVRTQLPYAAAIALISVVFGTLPVGFGWNVWVCLPLGIAAIIVWLRVFGRRVDE